jgi:hypothetical protein
MAITVDGMDFLEKNMPTVEQVVMFIKPESLLYPATAPTSAAPPAGGGVLNSLSRALQQRNQQAEDAQPRVAFRPK